MVRVAYSTGWNRSVQPRKQRKYRYHAPLHLAQRKFHVHLIKPLREKYHTRNIMLRKGDTVKIMKGQFARKEGSVERLTLRREQVLVHGMEIIKKDGTKVLYPFHPSALQIVQLDLSDRKRKKKLELLSQKASLKLSTQKELEGNKR